MNIIFFRVCALFTLVEAVNCWYRDMDITFFKPPEGLGCPSKRHERRFKSLSTKIVVDCDWDAIESSTELSWDDRCVQVYVWLDEMKTTRRNVACLRHNPKRSPAGELCLKGSLVGCSPSAGRETRSSKEHKRWKRQQWIQKCRRSGRYWHSIGDKISVPVF